MSSYQILEISPKALESEVRAAYKRLALYFHPDKVDRQDREVATEKFIEIQAAYEYCLKRCKIATVEDDPEDTLKPFWGDDESVDWRGKLPPGIGGSGTAWWSQLRGDEPAPVLRFAKVSAKAERNAYVKLTDMERVELDVEFENAYDDYEQWRRIHIEKRDQEDRLQSGINALPERLRDQARRDLDELRSMRGYTFDTGYQDGHDEDQYFHEWEAGLKRPTNTWRDTHNAPIVSNVTSHQRLGLFKKQVEALEQRIPTFNIKGRTEGDTKRKAKARAATEGKLMKEVEREIKVKRETEVQKKIRLVLRDAKSQNAALQEESTPYDRTVSTQHRITAQEHVPENWDEEVSDD